MKRLFKASLTLLLCTAVFVSGALAVEAAGSLKFDKTTVTVNSGSTFDLQVIVDPGTDSIAGTDAIITYNSTYLQAVSVTAGTFFPSVSNSITTGKVLIWAVTEPSTPKTGSGTIATVTFRALTNGTAAIQYYCDTTVGTTSKIVKNDGNATNIITCSLNQSAAVTIGTGANPTATSAPTPTTAAGTAATATPTVSQLPRTGNSGNTAPLIIGGAALLFFGAAIRYIFL